MHMRIVMLSLCCAIASAVSACDQRSARQPPPVPATAGGYEAPQPRPPLTIISFRVRLTIDCAAVTGAKAPSVDTVAGIASVIVLRSSDGHTIRLVSDPGAKPELAAREDGSYGLTLDFTPENPGDLEGQPLSLIDRVTDLGLRLRDILHVLDLEMRAAVTITAAVNDHSLPATAVSIVGDTADPDGFTWVNVGTIFTATSSTVAGATQR